HRVFEEPLAHHRLKKLDHPVLPFICAFREILSATVGPAFFSDKSAFSRRCTRRDRPRKPLRKWSSATVRNRPMKRADGVGEIDAEMVAMTFLRVASLDIARG